MQWRRVSTGVVFVKIIIQACMPQCEKGLKFEMFKLCAGGVVACFDSFVYFLEFHCAYIADIRFDKYIWRFIYQSHGCYLCFDNAYRVLAYFEDIWFVFAGKPRGGGGQFLDFELTEFCVHRVQPFADGFVFSELFNQRVAASLLLRSFFSYICCSAGGKVASYLNGYYEVGAHFARDVDG